MKKIIMMKGLPASGKTTVAKRIVLENPGMYKRVNKDDLRAMLDGGKWSKDNEKFVLQLRDHIVESALMSGKHVIVDDTNLHPKHHARMKELAKKHNVLVEFNSIFVPLDECIRRDNERANGVGEKVIRGMYKQFMKPAIEKVEFDEGLPSAYIFDVDGTIAKMVDRGPYDWHRVLEDNGNAGVLDVLKALKSAGHRIIICTGRDGVCEEDTKTWLERVGVEYDDFYIRQAGNTERDALIKRRMLDSIKDEYNVLGVFDDRDQVVEMWRSLGLRCFQVDYGDF